MRRLAYLLLLPLLLAACDSNNPDPTISPIEVQGTYRFTELRFVPDGSGIVPANVLQDRLNGDATMLELFADNARADLTYELQSASNPPPRGRISGTFTVTRTGVGLDLSGAGSATLAQLLLPATVTFERSNDDLVLAISTTQNLTAYNQATYGSGATSVPGTLRVRLDRQ